MEKRSTKTSLIVFIPLKEKHKKEQVSRKSLKSALSFFVCFTVINQQYFKKQCRQAL